MKRQHLLTLILASFFIVLSFHGVHAQSSVSGDDVCGGVNVKYDNTGKIISGACGVEHFKAIIGNIFSTIISIGLPMLIVFIVYRFVMAWYALQQGNANAYKEATQKVGQAVLGFIIVVAIMGGVLIAMFKYLGVDESFLNLINLGMIFDVFIPHAYAQQLPNPIPVVNNLYDFILTVLSLVMKFFLYPALISIWVWTGFSYVLAQGAPEKLMKTHKLLMWAAVSTLVVFMTQGFLVAVNGSVQKILGINTTTVQTQAAPSTNPNLSPCNGKAVGDTCQLANNTGKCNSSGVCDIGSPCTGKQSGELCKIGQEEGTCNTSSSCILFSNQILPATCEGVPVGSKCRLGQNLGTCRENSSVCFLDNNSGGGTDLTDFYNNRND